MDEEEKKKAIKKKPVKKRAKKYDPKLKVEGAFIDVIKELFWPNLNTIKQ